MSEAREEAERRWPRDWDVEDGTFRDGTVSGFTLGAEWQAARAAQVVPQPNREALVNAWYAQASRWHADGVISPATDVAWCAGWEARAALSPAPLTIDREAETELQECIEQEIELGGDAGSIAAAVREFLARMSDQPSSVPEIPDNSNYPEIPDGSRWSLAQVAEMIRRNCTPSTEAYQRGGDALISAVADWVENPPSWVAGLSTQPVEGEVETGDPFTCADLGHEQCDGSHPDHFEVQP